ncbi:serine hydrolase domain-containing protein [Fluctibacter halophilus]
MAQATAQVHPEHQWLDSFAEHVRQQAKDHNIPGMGLVFVEQGQPAHFEFYGKTERNGDDIDADTVFRLASVSKTFTGVLMAKLVEQRKLAWQTPLSRLAPEFGFTPQGHDRLTLAHLLSQSSGFSPNAYDNLIEANYPLSRVLNMLADLEPLCSPGRCYTYQNALFGVLEHYFESQQSSYQQQLTQQLFVPLNMPHASVGKVALQSSDSWAKPHIAITRSKWRKSPVENNYYRFSPAAGVNASLADMEIWLRALLGEYPDVMSQELVSTVTTPHIRTRRELRRRAWRSFLNDAHYGLGWRIYDFKGHTVNYHGGWVKGYRADVAFVPEFGVGYAMLMNAESNLINGFTAQFWSRFFAIRHAEGEQLRQQTAAEE